jgi:hypothetical protein
MRSARLGSLCLCIFGVFALADTSIAAESASGPVMRLFPTTLLDDIRETGEAAAAMETGLQDVVGRLDLQQQLYDQSLCRGADGDPGCARIAKQLGATYLEMLNVMNERLPDMERAVNNTRNGLQKRLREELGQRTTPTTLQNTLLGNATPKKDGASALSLRGRSGIRLSDRFKQYYQLVATHGESNPQSLAVVAADVYLDMEEAANLLAVTQEEIGRATLMEQLNQSLGLITPEMAAVVNGVKSILFGQATADGPIAGPPTEVGEKPFKSPLEL